MNIFLAVIFLVGGLAILWKSAELLVSGAVGLARLLGVSSLVIGLTVVAMGTSAPEVAASIAAVLRETGGGDIALGNVFGSNIANLALVGALVALIRPLIVKKKTMLREVPVMLAVALLLWPLLKDSEISRIDGAVLLIVFIGLLLLMIYGARRENREARLNNTDSKTVPAGTAVAGKCALFVIIGLAGLAIGAKITIAGAVFIGKEKLGLSDDVIGLTFIAFGTSLPELVTCVVAAVKGEHDISIGNLVGSNIFNTLLVTGAAGIVRPYDITDRLAGGSDYWIMIIVSAGFAGLIIIGRRTLGRFSGLLLLCGYLAYIIYLFVSGSANI